MEESPTDRDEVVFAQGDNRKFAAAVSHRRSFFFSNCGGALCHFIAAVAGPAEPALAGGGVKGCDLSSFARIRESALPGGVRFQG